MSNPHLIEVEALQAALSEGKEKIVLIDTRALDNYAKEHIPSAVNIHECFTFLAMSDAKGLKDLHDMFVNLFGKAGITGSDERVVVYEEGMASGFAQSCRGFFLLKWLGHPNVCVLHGGLVAWKKKGGTVTSEVPTPIPVSFKSNQNPSIMATKDEVVQALSSKSAVLLDVRDKEEWIGESSSPYGKEFCPRKGRLEGATWIEWYELMEKRDGVSYVKNPHQIREIFEGHGITEKSNIIVYCFKGSRAANTFLLLKDAGFSNVKNYFGSWNEWSRDPKLPIDDKKISL